MYANYLRERTEDQIYETDFGFVIYRFLDPSTDPNTVYIVDIYVKPDFRKSGKASEMADLVVAVAKKRGCTKLVGSVCPTTKGSHTSMLVLQGYGLKLDSCTNNFILFKKEI